MKKLNFTSIFATIFLFFVLPLALKGQTEKEPGNIKRYLIFGTDQITLNSATINGGGYLGSSKLIRSSANGNHGDGLYSWGRIELTNQSGIYGDVYSGNEAGVGGVIFSSGSSTTINGDVDVFGDIVISVNGSSITGTVNTTGNYSGPAKTVGNSPRPQTQPDFPLLTKLLTTPLQPVAGSGSVTLEKNVNYGDITGQKREIIFNGPGTYYINSFALTNTNTFIFDFNDAPTGVFKIVVAGRMIVGKVAAQYRELAGSSYENVSKRIFTEIQGRNSGTSAAFDISNGSSQSKSRWLGTVYSPNGSINLGSGTGNTDFFGSLWAGQGKRTPADVTGTTVTINSGVNFNYTLTEANFFTTEPNILPDYLGDLKVETPIGNELTFLYNNRDNIGTNNQINSVYFLSEDKKQVLIEVIATVNADMAALKSTLTGLGMNGFVPTGTKTLSIIGWFPIEKLLLLNDITSIRFVYPVFPPIQNTEWSKLKRSKSNPNESTTPYIGQGDKAIQGDITRLAFKVKDANNVVKNLSGAGNKIGVISDSYDKSNRTVNLSAAADIANGDLPASLLNSNGTNNVYQDFPYGPSKDEGRAMMQIIHDIAPGATLDFATGFISPGATAQNILDLKNIRGCNIIVDDMTYLNEPFFYDGVVAKAVKTVTENGAIYVTSAGNFGKYSLEDTYGTSKTWSPNGPTLAHDFGGGDTLYNVTLQAGSYMMVLQWEDEVYSIGESGQTRTGTQSDLDIYMTVDGKSLSGVNRNNLGGDPIEIFPFNVPVATTSNIMVVHAPSPVKAQRFKIIIFRGGEKLTFNEPSLNATKTNKSTIVGHANAKESIAVAAVRFDFTPPFTGSNEISTSTSPASFSSRGGLIMNGETSARKKPDLAGPNGVNTGINLGGVEFAGTEDSRPNFYGTSASAPHIAAAAALMQEANRSFYGASLTNDQVRTLLGQFAVKPNNIPHDNDFGYGYIQLYNTIASFVTPTAIVEDVVVPDDVVADGNTTFNVTIKGKFFVDGENSSALYLGETKLKTISLTETEIIAEVPLFDGEPQLTVRTPIQPLTDPITYTISNAVPFELDILPTVYIYPKNQTKQYGESNPPLTAESVDIFVSTTTSEDDKKPLAQTSFTLDGLGLTNNISLSYGTADEFSPVVPLGYPITSSATDATKLKPLLYNYVFRTGTLTVTKMPVTIKVKDKEIEYGTVLDKSSFELEITFGSNKIPNDVILKNKVLDSYTGANGTTTTEIGMLTGVFVDKVNNVSMLLSNKGYLQNAAGLLANVPAGLLANRSALLSNYSGLLANRTGALLANYSEGVISNSISEFGDVSWMASLNSLQTRAAAYYGGSITNGTALLANTTLVTNGMLFKDGEPITNKTALLSNTAIQSNSVIAEGISLYDFLTNTPEDPGNAIVNGGLLANSIDLVNNSTLISGNFLLGKLKEDGITFELNESEITNVAGLLANAPAGLLANKTGLLANGKTGLLANYAGLLANAPAAYLSNAPAALLANIPASLLANYAGLLANYAGLLSNAPAAYLSNTAALLANAAGLLANEGGTGSTPVPNPSAVILSAKDLESGINEFKGLFMITGNGVGEQWVAAPAYINGNQNFFITYDAGVVTVKPAKLELTVQVNGASSVTVNNAKSNPAYVATTSFGTLPTYTPTIAGFKFGETVDFISDGELITVYKKKSTGEIVTPPLSAGTYTVEHSYVVYQGADYLLNDDYVVKGKVVGELVVTPQVITITPDAGQTKIYGEPDPANFTFTYSPNSINFQGNTYPIQFVVDTKLGRTTGENVSFYSFNTGTLAVQTDLTKGIDAANYVLTIGGTEKFQITPRPVTVTADPVTIDYGTALNRTNLTYKVSYILADGTVKVGLIGTDKLTGLLNIVNSSSVLNAGIYPIVQGDLVVTGNYSLAGFIGSNLTVKTGKLTVTGPVTGIELGAATPDFGTRFTYSGLVASDEVVLPQSYDLYLQDQTTGALTLVANPSATLTTAGVYKIRPKNTSTRNKTTAESTSISYEKVYQDGTLYVNPNGPGVKRIRPILDCIVDLQGQTPNNINGFRYVARFIYQNDNSVPEFIPRGDFNKIVATRANTFDPTALPPEVFLPGTGRFDVPFNGTKIYWSITSNEDGTRTSASSQEASSKSNKCNASNSLTTTTVTSSAISSRSSEELAVSSQVYPNPVKTRVTITVAVSEQDLNNIRIFDIQGRMFKPVSSRRISSKAIELDLTNLPKGQYLIRLNNAGINKAYKIIKD